jgi:hypothetical protein
MYRKKKNYSFPKNSFFFNPIAMERPLMEEEEVNAMLNL